MPGKWSGMQPNPYVPNFHGRQVQAQHNMAQPNMAQPAQANSTMPPAMNAWQTTFDPSATPQQRQASILNAWSSIFGRQNG